jgi:hypothetical protein
MSSGKSLTTTNMEPASSSGTAGKATSNSLLEHQLDLVASPLA